MKTLFFIIIQFLFISIMILVNCFENIYTKIILNLFLLFLIFLVVYKYKKNKDRERYDYEKENPNALISGRVIGGTVYTSYPENSPGLGWIL